MMQSTLHVGDEVVTMDGVHGTISSLTGENIVLKTGEGVQTTFSRSAIARNLSVHKTADAP